MCVASIAPQQLGNPDDASKPDVIRSIWLESGHLRWCLARSSMASINLQVTWDTVDCPTPKEAPTETWDSPEANLRKAIATCFSTLRSLPSMLMSPEGGLEMRSSLTSEQIYSKVFFETRKKCLNPSSSSSKTSENAKPRRIPHAEAYPFRKQTQLQGVNYSPLVSLNFQDKA